MIRFFDRFLPAGVRADPDGLRRGRFIVGAAFGLTLAIALGLAVRLTVASMPPAAAVLFVSLALAAAAPWLLRATGSLHLGGGAVIAALFAVTAAAGWAVGGLDGVVLMVVPLLPMLAVYLLGSRAGGVTLMLVLVAIAVCIALPHLGVDIPPSSLGWLEELTIRGVLLGLITILATFLVAFSERQRIDAEARLRRSEEMYRKLFEQSKDIVAVSTAAGDLVDVNQAGVDFWGAHSKAQLLQQNVVQSYADPGERQKLLERLEREGFVRDLETTHRTHAGELRILQGTTSTIRSDDGSVELLLSILRDVTARRRAEAERERLFAELAAKNAELEHFSYVLSHDLKGPLTTIRGFVSLLYKDAAADRSDRMERYCGIVDGAAAKMGRMVDDLLELSRLGSGGVERAEVSLAEVAREAVELLAGPIAQAGAEVAIADDLPVIRGDRRLLLTIFQNLIDNGVKYSAHRADPEVRVAARDGGGETVVTVRDNGAGIAAGDQGRVFELFQTLDPASGGSGVGLASVQRAVELHGGRVWVESEGEGRGSTFCFTVPRG